MRSGGQAAVPSGAGRPPRRHRHRPQVEHLRGPAGRQPSVTQSSEYRIRAGCRRRTCCDDGLSRASDEGREARDGRGCSSVRPVRVVVDLDHRRHRIAVADRRPARTRWSTLSGAGRAPPRPRRQGRSASTRDEPASSPLPPRAPAPLGPLEERRRARSRRRCASISTGSSDRAAKHGEQLRPGPLAALALRARLALRGAAPRAPLPSRGSASGTTTGPIDREALLPGRVLDHDRNELPAAREAERPRTTGGGGSRKSETTNTNEPAPSERPSGRGARARRRASRRPASKLGRRASRSSISSPGDRDRGGEPERGVGRRRSRGSATAPRAATRALDDRLGRGAGRARAWRATATSRGRGSSRGGGRGRRRPSAPRRRSARGRRTRRRRGRSRAARSRASRSSRSGRRGRSRGSRRGRCRALAGC